VLGDDEILDERASPAPPLLSHRAIWSSGDVSACCQSTCAVDSGSHSSPVVVEDRLAGHVSG